MAGLVDTNVLVYLFEPQDRRKQRIATKLLEGGLRHDSLRIAHQVIVEFVSAVTRPRRGKGPLLSGLEASREGPKSFWFSS